MADRDDPTTAAGSGLSLTAFAICMMVLPTIVVALRFWSRALVRSFWWDDWLVLLSLPLAIGQSALHIYSESLGVGKHIDTIPKENVSLILKVLWASYFLGDAGVSLPKASVLLFYQKIFTTQNRGFKFALYLAHTLNFLWWLSSIARCLLFCDPVAKYWDRGLPGFCRNADSLYIGSAVPSVVIDIFILLLPLPMMWQLHLKRGRKALISIVFLCGYIVPAISLGRLITSIVEGEKLNQDLTYYGLDLLFWVEAEPPMSIISISLPACFSLFRKVHEHGFGVLFRAPTKGATGPTSGAYGSAKKNYLMSPSRQRNGTHASSDTEFQDFNSAKDTGALLVPKQDLHGSEMNNDSSIEGGRSHSNAEPGESPKLGGIAVKKSFEVTRDSWPLSTR